ncbi:molybdopterin-dependent oxidoreductase [Candidatus Mycobacterium wuenschmannii]|uniref:Molybdopterin-dependent oxidoreductase n=1 Tax=Candidatus Mycobacterium wuenschmannii TaxID=3027808 RepID=A0ABY8VW80_9MYCO|nr:molybdopterin-dependent oxidoreductase [Candidatus Mycobacterium wuenschmannii]WIM87280.1 molybdopterin-dependent oxidoreductase [Candidatus Mycobacterium wuenschmannii]
MTDDEPTAREDYGFPARLWRTIERRRPPGFGRLQRFRSPLRGLWLTSVFGSVLLVALPIVIVTGLVSYIVYAPQFGTSVPADVGWLKLPTFDWPTHPVWLYRLTQGLHVGLGLVLIPVVLAKLWSVIPKLFAWPPARSIAQVLERLSIAMLVGGILFEMVTGLLYIQYDYLYGFSFFPAHYYGTWVFIAGFVIHITLKIPRMVEGLRSRSMREVLRTNTADTRPEPQGPHGLVAEDPAPATMSRRGALGLVGGGVLLTALVTVGQTIGGVARHLPLLLPTGDTTGKGPNDFRINKTAKGVGLDPAATGPSWRLTLRGGPAAVVLKREMLAAMPQHSARLPIACVQGWSTVQAWSGVRLADLARLAGVPSPRSAAVDSLGKKGKFNHATLEHHQVTHPDALLALRVNGADLSLDHGYPARIIVPAINGVHNTKWVKSIDFEAN